MHRRRRQGLDEAGAGRTPSRQDANRQQARAGMAVQASSPTALRGSLACL